MGGPILVRQSNYKWRKGGIGAEAPLMSLKGQTINYKLYIIKIDRYSLIEQSKFLIEQTAHKVLSCIYPQNLTACTGIIANNVIIYYLANTCIFLKRGLWHLGVAPPDPLWLSQSLDSVT